MPMMSDSGLSWLITLFKKYFGIPWSLSGDTKDIQIPTGDNLNDYTTIGNYYCRPDSVASQIQNCPSQTSFIMKVYSGAGYSPETSNQQYLTQYVENNKGSSWLRYKTTDSWSPWISRITNSGEAVGSGTTLTYVDDGKIVASNATVGSGVNPVYLNNGVITPSNSTVGGSLNPMYFSSGEFVASTSTVGSSSNPIYMNSGTITASNSTIGGSSSPVYLKSGVITVCGSVGNLSVSSYSFGEKGYVKFSMGLIIQWGTRKTTADNTSSANYTVTFPTSFSSGSSYVIIKNGACSTSGNTYDYEGSFWNKTKTTAYTKQLNATTDNEEWLAFGY